MQRIMFLKGMTETASPPLPIRYIYRSKPMSAETMLILEQDRIKAIRGPQSFDVRYKDVVAVWLSFIPRGGYLTGFRTKIYARDRRTITLDDTTFSSFFVQERQGIAYRTFVLTLIERVRAENSQAQIMGGRPFWPQAATIIFGTLFGVMLPVMGLRTLGAGQWALGVIFLAFAAVFAGWTWTFIQRNRLRNLKSGVPEDLLPSSDPKQQD